MTPELQELIEAGIHMKRAAELLAVCLMKAPDADPTYRLGLMKRVDWLTQEADIIQKSLMIASAAFKSPTNQPSPH